MSDTETIPATSDSLNAAEFLREFSDRVESVEFVKKVDGAEIRTVFNLRDCGARAEGDSHA